MKDNITPFGYDDKLIRVITDETTGEPLWVAKDVCDVLEYAKVDRALAKLDADEKGTQILSTLGGEQKMSVINESGLYNLIFRSNKPEAKKFKKWVTSEVLPSIRKTGSYSVGQSASTKDENYSQMFMMLSEMTKAITELASAINKSITNTQEAMTETAMMVYSIDESLHNANISDTLSSDMLDAIKAKVGAKAKTLSKKHSIPVEDMRRLMFGKLNTKFAVDTYYKIFYSDFHKAIYFIDNLTLTLDLAEA